MPHRSGIYPCFHGTSTEQNFGDRHHRIQFEGQRGNVVYSQTKDGITMRDYVVPHNPRTPLQQAGRNLFGRAAAHWKTLNATERPFFGDTITVSAMADNGQLVFTSDAPNAPHLITKFWMQPLANEFRRPIVQRYRLKGHAAFAVGGLAVSIPVVRGGFCAPAYRFVNRLTGQETPFVELPPVTVS